MRKEDLLDVINDVDDELLERAGKAPYKKKQVWGRWLSLAACACIVLVAGLWYMDEIGTNKSDCAMESVEPDSAKDDCAEEEIFGDVNTDSLQTSELNPLAEADITHSVLEIYKYDGKKIVAGMIVDNDIKEEILDMIANLTFEKVEDWSTDQITYPIYGVGTGTETGNWLEVAWSNYYWIGADGTVCKTDFDLSVLETEYEWEHEREVSSMTAFPKSWYLSRTDSGWNAENMWQVSELEVQKDIKASLVKQTEKYLTVSMENTGEKEVDYGRAYTLQVKQEGIWYEVPWFENVDFTMEAIILPPGDTVEETYSLEYFGDLPEGTYRLVVSGCCAVEFSISK